jgi:3-phenylpropionate/trans-cinnamate dioxygenase ferredoxin reductase component
MFGSEYLIVGGGMTAAAAARGIREVDPDGDITIIGAEPDPPYKRPPLSKGLWHDLPMERVWSDIDSDSVDLRLGRWITRVDAESGHAFDDRGDIYRYGKLLIATGSSPRILPSRGERTGRIVHFRTLRDYHRLRALAETGERFAVIGGGFVGSELASVLAALGKRVTMIFPDPGIGSRIFPPRMSMWLNGYFSARGVEVVPGATVTGIQSDARGAMVGFSSPRGERAIEVDGVVVGIGTTPNVGFARDAGLPVGDGVLVDQFLNAGHPDIFAAGDVASVPVPALGGRRRFEHENQAKATGLAAGRAMAGAPEPYTHLPFFYSDLFDLGYEAVGDVDAGLDTVADWDEPYHEGVVYYLRDGRVRGVLLWNVWGQVEAARELVRADEPVDRDDVRGWLLAKPLARSA